ncbi:MAG TPA: hypothetical protein VND94_18595 [Terriglobia bacterium]|nr:hypothetical protein [Terriglobia bacterium]
MKSFEILPYIGQSGLLLALSPLARSQSDRMAAGRVAKPSASLDEKIFQTTENWHLFSIVVSFPAAAKTKIHISHCKK